VAVVRERARPMNDTSNTDKPPASEPALRHPLAVNEGEMAARVRAFPWETTPLGPIEQWPQSLRTAVSICLNSRFPMFVWWGAELTNIYNDGYIPMLGARHPNALGKPARASWDDIWAEVGRQADLVMKQGLATWNERAHLRMERYGYPEDTWFTWSYSPIVDESGNIGGLFCAVTEDTPRVRAEQQRDRLQEAQQRAQARDRFLVRADDSVRRLSDPNEIVRTIATLLGQYLDVDRCAYAEVDADQDTMSVTGNYTRNADIVSIVGRLRFGDFGAEVLHLMRAGRPYIVHDVDSHEPPIGNVGAYRSTQIQAVICVPLLKNGRFVAAMAVHSATPRSWKPDEIELVQLIANRCWESLERARVTRSLEESENRFRALVTASSDVVYRMSPDWSEMWRLDGRNVMEDTARPTRDWINKYIFEEDQPLVLASIEAAIRDKRIFELEHRVRRTDGTIGWTFSRAVPIVDESGEIIEWFGAASDVSARKEAEETLKASEAALKEADRRKDQFLATLAHELRNPLAPIRQAAAIVNRSAATPVQISWSHEVIERQVNHMSLLLDDLLDVSRITRGRLELACVNVMLSDVIDAALETARPLIDAARHVVKVDVPAEPLELHADPLRLSQVLANLLTNAAKYTNPGGSIDLTVRKAGVAIEISVRDNGIGIEPHLLGSMFEMFWQGPGSKHSVQAGLGIGLALARGLVELHGGTLTAHSDGLGRGAEFLIRLPLSSVEALKQDKDTAHAEQTVAAAPNRVLVVDDNADAATSLAMLLRLQGHEVEIARDGITGLEVAKRFRPRVALLDLGMPRMNGYELARRLRELDGGAQMTLVAVTGWGQAEDRRRTAAAGFDHHLTKPIDPSLVEALLADPALRGGQAPAGSIPRTSSLER
jgi:signal transduction histidine kinase/ActR/RegA family two-component response regulator